MRTLNRADRAKHSLVMIAVGLLMLFSARVSHADPALGPAEEYFDPQSAALVRAALANDAARVRELVMAGVNPNSQGPRSADKNTPQITLLGYAISQRSAAAMRVLIQAGADPLFTPRVGDGNAFAFAIVRNDGQMLEALYRFWPLAKVPAKTQAANAVETLEFDCILCLVVMFQNGLPVDVQDERGYDLLMTALSREDFTNAEWLLREAGVTLHARSSRGVTAANHLQNQIGRYPPGTPIPDVLLRLQALMQAQGIVFPVETSVQWRAVRGIE